jgi:predicted ABC-type sugar transport system permease subunit
MKLRSFIVTFGSFALTGGMLYLIGHAFTIPLLMFQHEYTDNAYGLFITTGSLVPIIIGLVVSFFAEKIYLYKYR